MVALLGRYKTCPYPDNHTMYFTDSPLCVIYAYDFDPTTGAIENRRPFVRTPDEEGVPDGLTVDSQGFVWSARWGGWKVTRHRNGPLEDDSARYDPAGKVEREVRLPVQYPTSCTFGGPRLDELYVTSAWTALSEEERGKQPWAGDLSRLRAGVKGLAEPKFLG